MTNDEYQNIAREQRRRQEEEAQRRKSLEDYARQQRERQQRENAERLARQSRQMGQMGAMPAFGANINAQEYQKGLWERQARKRREKKAREIFTPAVSHHYPVSSVPREVRSSAKGGAWRVIALLGAVGGVIVAVSAGAKAPAVILAAVLGAIATLLAAALLWLIAKLVVGVASFTFIVVKWAVKIGVVVALIAGALYVLAHLVR